jgi:glycosyltransferase involved in cell wall biosynthesis
MLKVLFLSQWYPNRYDAMSGLFVQKHAEAVSLYCEVRVLYVHADETIEHFETENKKYATFSELIIYYPAKKNNPFYIINKIFNFLLAYYKGLKYLKEENFIPDITHANVLTRTVLIAYFLKKLKHIPYVVTEHWSRYLPERNGYKGIIRKFATRLVVKNAKAILPVSEMLKKAMIYHKLLNSNYIIVNNVVDHFFYEETVLTTDRKKKRIIHISCFDEQAKNIKGIIRATYELSKIRQDFELILIGIGLDFKSVSDYAETFDFPKGIVHFLGEQTPEEVADWLKNSDFLVMFSNYETAGVVIAESLVSGIPVLTTDVGVAPGCVNESNGIIISRSDENVLFEKMSFLLNNLHKYNHEEIKKNSANKFSYQSIGNQLYAIYNNALLINK